MEHHFNTQVAKDYGLESAVILHNIYHWIDHNRANNTNLHDGRYWTYNSNEAFAIIFPYINKTKIQRTLKKLIEDGILLKGNYNKLKFDHTAWYAFSDKGMEYMISVGYGDKSAIHDDSADSSFCNNRKSQSEPTIPNNNPYNNPNNNLRESKENSHSLESDNENGTKELSSVNTPSRLQDKKEKTKQRERTAGGCAPTEQEVRQFFHDRGFIADYRKFYLYYKAKGWKDIEDWEAQAELWELREGSPSDYRRMDAEVAKAQGRVEKKRDTEYEEYCRRLEKEGKK